MKKLYALLLLLLLPISAHADLKGVITHPTETNGGFTTGNCVKFSNTGTSDPVFQDAGFPCGNGTGSGNVTGPASSTDSAITRFDGLTGLLLKNSTVTISDSGAFTGASIDTASAANVIKVNGTSLTAVSGTGAVALINTPVLTTPNIGNATGNITGNAGTAAALQTARNIGGVSFDGTAQIVPQTIQVIDAAGDTTTFPMLATSATGSLQPATDTGLSYNATSHALTATTFIGALNGNADTATTTTTATTATNATNTAITDDTSTNATMYPTWVTAATGNLPQKVSSTKLTFNPSTATLTTTSFSGALSGNASTASSAAKWTTARNLAGNSVDGTANVAFANAFIVKGTADSGLSGAQFLGALGTGIVKNTTTTGVLSIAVAGDFPTLNQNTTGSAASLTTGRTMAITGDLSYTSPSFDGTGNVTAAGTLATVNSNVGTFGSATKTVTATVNGKGLVTAISEQTATPAVGSITGLGTGVATWLATPSSANLISAVTDETGSGALVFGTSPTLTTAVLGSSTATTQSPADNSTKVATTAYVDSAVLGQNYKEAVKYASTAALPSIVYANGSSGVGATLTGVALGAISLDSSSPAVNDRVLVKNQVSTFQNGIYTVTATGSGAAVFVLTRATDANQTTEFKTGDAVFVTSGSTLSNTTWAYTGVDSPTMGTDAITYAQIAGQGTVTSGNGITVTGLSVAINTAVTVDKTTAQALTNKDLSGAGNTFPTFNQNTTGSAATLTTARTIGGVSFDGSANITVATATGGFTVSGGDLALGANNLTMTGSLGATGARLTKGWFTDLQVTNAISGSITGLAGTATALASARTLWGQSFDGTGNITGSLTSVGDITGGASNMTVTSGTGNSRTLVLRTTTSGGTATTALTLGADQAATFAGAVSVTGHTTFEGVTSTGATGTGKLVYDGTPTLVTPVIGAATGTSVALTALSKISAATGAAALPTVQTGVLFQMGNADSTADGFQLDAFAATPTIWGERSQGTIASKTAVTGSTSLLNINGAGYDGSAYSARQAGIQLATGANTWGVSDHGTTISFVGTPDASTTAAVWATFANSNLKIGGTAARGTTEGTAHIDCFNGTAPVGTLTNGASIYCASGAVLAMDSTGQATVVSSTKSAPAISATKSANFTVLTYTPASAVGQYVVSGVITTTSSTNTGTVQLTVDYVDSQGTTHTADVIPLVDAAGSVAATKTGASKEFHSIPYVITINNAGSNIVLKAVITGTVSYTVTGFVTQVF